MKRINTFLLLGLCVLSMGACGKLADGLGQSGQAPLKVQCKMTDILGEEESYTLELTSRNRSSGVISFKSVRNGNVEQLEPMEFRGMKKGSIEFKVSQSDFSLQFSNQGSSRVEFSMPNIFPDGAVDAGTEMVTESLIEPDGSEQVLWVKSFFVGEEPASYDARADYFQEVVENTKRYPTMISYVVTIKLDNDD